VNAKLGVRVLSWEEQLRTLKKPQMEVPNGHFLCSLLFFGMTAVISAASGAGLLLLNTQRNTKLGMPGWATAVLSATAILWGLVTLGLCVHWHLQQKADVRLWDTETAEGWPAAIPPTGQHAAASTSPGGMPLGNRLNAS
jgi:hypothetical protein